MDLLEISEKMGPNDEEIREEFYRARLADHTARLARLQEEMEQLSSAHLELCNQRDLLSRRIGDYRGFMSPMRRLPVDIIQQIFLRCLPTKHHPVMSHRESPMLLTQVCSSWRRIAHSFASLWDSIHVVIPSEFHHSGYNPPSLATYLDPSSSHTFTPLEITQRRAEGLKQWLARSGECSLKISLYDAEKRTLNIDEPYNNIIDTLLRYSCRWETLMLHTPFTLLKPVAALSESDVPLLKSLTITGYTTDRQLDRPILDPEFKRFWTKSSLLRAPQLGQISYINAIEDFAKFPLSWSQLTAISITSSTINYVEKNRRFAKLVNILRSCPQLVHCALDISISHSGFSAHGPVFDGPPISLPNLQTLSAQGSAYDLSLLFCAVRDSPLRELEFRPHASRVSNPLVRELSSFLPSIARTLRKLTIDPSVFTESQFFEYIGLCPRITYLALKKRSYPPSEWTSDSEMESGRWDGYWVRDSLLHELITPRSDGEIFLPNLTVLECFAKPEFSDTMILDFIRAKRSGIVGLAKLRRVSMDLSRAQTKSMKEELNRFVEGGLECYISYIPQPNERLPDSVFDGTLKTISRKGILLQF